MKTKEEEKEIDSNEEEGREEKFIFLLSVFQLVCLIFAQSKNLEMTESSLGNVVI
jgi:hypothetical protein